MISKNIKHRITHLLTIKNNIRSIELFKSTLNDKFDRIYQYHIRKTGGKSLLFMFLANECQDYYKKYEELYSKIDHRIFLKNKVFVLWHPILLQKGNYFFGSSHIPHHEIKLPDRTFTITCLRDPVDRVVAHYEMLEQRKILENQHWGMKREFRWLNGSFDYFLNSIPRHDLLNQLFMFSKSFTISEAVENILKCNHIYFLESFDEGIKTLENKIGIKLKLRHDDPSSNNCKISKTKLDRLRDILSPEYEFIEKIKQCI